MLFDLFIFFSHMNWHIPSFSGSKLTIRMIHVHIVIQCHLQTNMQQFVRNSVTFLSCRQTLSPFNLTRHSLGSIVILQTFISTMRVNNDVVSLVYLLFQHELAIPSYSGSKLTIRMIQAHIVMQCHSQANMQELVRNLLTFCPCRQILFLFNLTQHSLASIVILLTFISTMTVNNNVVSLVYLPFPHELAHSLLLSG